MFRGPVVGCTERQPEKGAGRKTVMLGSLERYHLPMQRVCWYRGNAVHFIGVSHYPAVSVCVGAESFLRWSERRCSWEVPP